MLTRQDSVLADTRRGIVPGLLLIALTAVLASAASTAAAPYVLVLGVAQDGGVPQSGDHSHPGWTNPAKRRLVTSLALVDPDSGERWLFDATPDLPEQLHRLHTAAPRKGRPLLDGIFLTHAHMGHYTGLMYLGHEAMGSQNIPVHAMPRMADYLRSNGPWSQLVRYNNISLSPLADGQALRLNQRLTVTPLLVPHRQEFSEVVGYRIDGPSRSALFIPDIDSWEQWDAAGTRIEQVLRTVDVAWLDATFYNGQELPGRDMSGFPHPFISHSMDRFSVLPAGERSKVRFIHFNHSNPALWPDSAARAAIRAGGFHLAAEGERQAL